MTMIGKSIVGLAIFGMIAAAGCGSGGEVDQKLLASKRCKEEIKKALRDPDSARFGEREYIVKIKSDGTEFVSHAPSAENAYELLGTVNSRNGFGGMGEPRLYKCQVAFDGHGQIIDGRTGAWDADSTNFLDNYIRYLQDDAIGPIVTKTVKPDGSQVG